MFLSIKNLIYTKELGFNIRYYLFFFLSIALISMIFQKKLIQITQEYKEYRLLRETYHPSFNEYILKPEVKLKLLAYLLKETYIGTWTSSYLNLSCENGSHELNKTGDIEIIFQVINWNKSPYSFYYNYYIILFEGNDNTHSITISNSFPFSFEENYPILFYDNLTEKGTFSNAIKSSVNEYNYLLLTNHSYLETNITMGFDTNAVKRHNNFNQLDGSISFNDTNYYFNLKQISPSVYQSIFAFTSWLSIIGVAQAVLFQYMKSSFDRSPNETLKYCPYTFGINCVYNGAIGFECFLASMINERLFYSFIIPSVLFFGNFCLFELKLMVITWRNYEFNRNQQRRRRSNVVIDKIKSKLINFCLFFYIVLIGLFIYSYDVFFWKPIIYCLVSITFLPQIIFSFRRKEMISITYLLTISLTKLYIPIYFRLKGNFLRFEEDRPFITAIISILIVQIIIVLIEGWFHCGRKLENCDAVIKINRRRNQLLKKYHKTIETLIEMNMDMNNV